MIGWELFSCDTSSYAHAHPIDFINPESHLLGENCQVSLLAGLAEVAATYSEEFELEESAAREFTLYLSMGTVKVERQVAKVPAYFF